MTSSQKKLDIAELNQIYSEAQSVDQDIFAEQRSNILLIAGEHYTKKNARSWQRIRDSKDIPSEQKLRITKNHIQKITKTYVNNITSHAPGVTVLPASEKEMRDRKAAELNKAVWQHIKSKHKIKKKIQEWASDFIEIGEVAVKIFWDEFAGEFVGYEGAVDDEGNPVVDENGQQPPDTSKPVFTGDFVFERVFGFNLLRSSEAQSMDEAKCLIVRKMANIADLKKRFKQDDEKLKLIEPTENQTWMVFDASQGGYSQQKNQTMLREYYFRPSPEYPKGYFFITTEAGILWEGELPFGIFPIVYEGFDAIQTTPRHHSIVKHLRPYQVEVNRCASKIAEHQSTLGDDKLITQSGAKVTSGVNLAGVRQIQVAGKEPIVVPGRAGEQFLGTMTQNISEMYDVSNVMEDKEEQSGQFDPFSMLFRSMRNKKKFSRYSEKFEGFLVQVCEVTLELAKKYLPDDMLIPAISRLEMVNIPEFKSTEKTCYQIKIEPLTDDLESMMGKQLILNHTLQYVGNKLERDDIGRLMRAMPFGNFEESFEDFTLKQDRATNIILALDRGEKPKISEFDDHEYMLNKLSHRMSQADFQTFSPEIQANYEFVFATYRELAIKRAQELKAMEADFIPTGGSRVKVDVYVPSKTNPNKSERATLPIESVQWLIDRLAQQGSAQEVLSQMNQGAVEQIASKMNVNEGEKLAQTEQGQPLPPQMGAIH